MLSSAPERKEPLFPLHSCPGPGELVWMQGKLSCLCQLSHNKLHLFRCLISFPNIDQIKPLLTEVCMAEYWWGQGVSQRQDNLLCWKSTNLVWVLWAKMTCSCYYCYYSLFKNTAGLSTYRKICKSFTFTKPKEWLQDFILLQQWICLFCEYSSKAMISHSLYFRRCINSPGKILC